MRTRTLPALLLACFLTMAGGPPAAAAEDADFFFVRPVRDATGPVTLAKEGRAFPLLERVAEPGENERRIAESLRPACRR